MSGTYDPLLLVLSVIVAIFASYTALDMAGRVTMSSGHGRRVWLAGGSLAMGIGIWSMHFTGMLAFHLPVPIAYDVPLWLLSIAIAIATSLLALFVVSRPEIGPGGFLSAGLGMGAAIAGMHYTGMAAMRIPGEISYDPRLVALSLAIAVAASVAALWLAFRFRGDQSRSGRGAKAAAGVAMGFAIAGMHYTGMAATRFTHSVHQPQAVGDRLLTPDGLALPIVAGTLAVLGLAMMGSIIDRRIRARLEEAEAVRQSENRFRALVAATTEIVWLTDPDGMAYPGQQEWCAFTGQGRGESGGMGWLDAVHPDDRARSADAWSAALRRRTSLHLEHRVRRFDGEYRDFTVRAVPVVEPDGRVREWVGTHTDITDRKRAQEEREFLGEASRVLATSLDYETTLETIARLAVPRFADWCAVNLIEGEGTRLVAVAHSDPERDPIARELRWCPFAIAAGDGTPQVIATGRPALHAQVSDEFLLSAVHGSEIRQILRRLGTRSALVVPLVARGQTLGTLSLVYGDSGRRYGPGDLDLAEELARRAAIAADHARLFRQTEEARVTLEEQAMELEFQMEELQNQAAQLEENQAELEMANDELQRANTALGAAEAHYRRLVETSPHGVFVLNAEGVFTEINPAGGRILGYPGREVLGRRFGEVIGPEDLGAAGDVFDRVIAGRDSSLEVELSILLPTGERRLVSLVVTGIEEGGGVVGIHGVSRDITEERQNQLALRESEATYRALFDSLTELVYIQDLEGRILTVNDAVLRRYGYSRDEILGRGPEMLWDPELTDMVAVRESFLRACRGERREFEFWGRARTGESFPNEVTLIRGRYFGQDVVIAVGRETTERKQAEEQAREAQRRDLLIGAMELERRRLSVLFEQSPTLIALLEGSDHVFDVTNAYFDRLVGGRDVRGKPIREALPEVEGQGYFERIDEVYRTGEAYVGRGNRVMIQRTPGAEPEEGYFNFVFQPFVGPDGNTTGVFLHGVEVTDVVRAKQEAEAANQAKSEFLSRMSHELRTPLTAILGFGQLLELDVTSDDGRESVQHVLKAGKHLLALIDEVLDIARIETGKVSLSVEPVSIREVVSESLDLVRLSAAKQGIVLRAQDALRSEVFVQADQQRLKQVLLNLLSNAIKYNRAEGSVTLSCEDAGDGRARISVHDTGYGITVVDRDRLFHPFERLGADQLGVEGTGLGLALSKGLVEAMSGTLGVESVQDVGSHFWVELPLASRPDSDGSGLKAEAGDLAPGAAVGTCTVLFIEDNLANVRLMECIFQRRPQVRLLTAMQGSLGLELVREHRPDLILLDLNLPDLSGDKVLLQLRRDPTLRNIPVVMVSGDAIPSQVQRMLSLGARGYVTKPFDVRELLRLVDEHLPLEEPTAV